ncbi:MAG: PSD1 and planctomycete cytochrome C domain-containing protein [Planctomycetota bacterium]|nr:PSD1 and planctomycete cytochrome C domain-containing protein [Planctomycetota bacterium]
MMLVLTGSSDPVDFSSDVRPILASNCFLCHGPDHSTRKAKLRLDLEESALSGVVVPGKPGESELLRRISHDGEDRMPPGDRQALSPAEVDILHRWIEQGAHWEEHWSWEPIADPPLPGVSTPEWAREPLDHFVLARLEDAGLAPATEAESAALLRRLTYDLTGLPPTPGDIEAWRAKDLEVAYEQAVERLLASPRFGEHWGRHWLDLVRYAETCGHEFDYPIPHAWHYRDWVIHAYNEDIPYDRFVLEQLAGDLLENPRRHPVTGVDESITGTGVWYLAQGTHAPVDVREDGALRIENQIDVLGTAFLGLSVQCARCHDHKFDPISTEDYYALAGFFRSTRRQNAYLDPNEAVARAVGERTLWNARQVQGLEMNATPVDSTEPDLDAFCDFDGDSYGNWFTSGWAFGDGPAHAGDLILEGGVPMITSASSAHSGRIAPECQGTLRSPTFTIDEDALHIRARGQGCRIRLVIDGFILGEYNPLLFEGHIIDIDSKSWTTLSMDTSRYQGHRAHLAFMDDGDGYLVVDAVKFGPIGEVEWFLPESTAIDTVNEQLAQVELEGTPPAIPVPVRVLAAQDGTPEDEYVFIRGEHRNPGPIVPRRFIASIGGEAQEAVQGSSGRLELADRILDASNPFPARIMVNRTWHHLFGQGLSGSPDELGAMGMPPTHPELLDHLATRFRSNWSMKDLVRSIVMSSTYRMGTSNPDPRCAEIDPDNLLLHSAPRRRLGAEALRDSVLAVSGRLDMTMGGSPVPVHLTEFMTGRGRPGASGPLDGNGRRSIYQEVRRNFLPPMLQAWDLPVPCRPVGVRLESNVPSQYLVLMNDPFIREQAGFWADRLLEDASLDLSDRIEQMYLSAYGRPPSSEETALAHEFLAADAERSQNEVLADFAHVLFNTKEFVFLD